MAKKKIKSEIIQLTSDDNNLSEYTFNIPQNNWQVAFGDSDRGGFFIQFYREKPFTKKQIENWKKNFGVILKEIK